jgi:GT2 family glycosyltransferase
LRKKALDEGYDYFFSLEQDVIPPSNVLEVLLNRKKELVAGTYMNPVTRPDGKQNVVSVVAYIHPTPQHEKDHLLLPLGLQELFPSRLIEVAFAGLGAMLIKTEVLEKTEFRFKQDKIAFDDMYFGRDNREKGILTYLDSSVLCKHLFSQSFVGLKKEEF